MSGPAREVVDTETLHAAFAVILDRGIDLDDTCRARSGRELPRCVRQLIDAIHEALFDPLLSVQALKSQCGIQDNNVSSRFRREMGLSIKQYIDRLRLDTARQLLLDTKSSVFEVSQTVGYDHPQTFYRAFHRSFKCTPGNLRERHG